MRKAEGVYDLLDALFVVVLANSLWWNSYLLRGYFQVVSSIIKCNSVVIKYHRGIPRWYLGQKTYFCVANEKESTFNPRAKVSNIRFIARGA